MTDSSSDRLLIAKAKDVIKLSEKTSSLKYTDFLTPAEAALVDFEHLSGAFSKQVFFGGYDGAERTVYISYPDFLEECPTDDIISVIVIRGRDIASLNHRDYLGSIMGLGIKREKIGDIVVFDDKAFVFALPDMAEYIKNNLAKIGNTGVTTEVLSAAEITVPEKKTEEIKGTVSTVRLDSVLAVSLKTSRSKAMKFIEAEKVQVNWKIVSDSAFKIKEGDIFSVRGFGRFKFFSVNGETKKGRISITVRKYI